MGAQASFFPAILGAADFHSQFQAMVAMKAMKAGNSALSKGGIADALSTKTGLKKKVCSNILSTLAEVGASEVKKNGKFTVPGVCFIKTRLKPATKAGKK